MIKADGQNDCLRFISEEMIRAQGIFSWDTVEEIIKMYGEKDYNVQGAYYIDYLQIVLTVTMLVDMYRMSV